MGSLFAARQSGRDVGATAWERAMQKVLRIWLLATALFLTGAMIWAFVPVLVPMIGLTIAIGILVAAIVAVARWLERMRGGPPGGE